MAAPAAADEHQLMKTADPRYSASSSAQHPGRDVPPQLRPGPAVDRDWPERLRPTAPSARPRSGACTSCCSRARASRSTAAAPASRSCAEATSTTSPTRAADDALVAVLAQARQLPRRQPLHHLGLQVRAARGRGQGPPPRLAGTRSAARARKLGRDRRPRLDTAAGRRDERAVRRPRRAIETELPRTSARCSSPSRSTTSRSTCSPNGSTRPAERSTRPSTTPAANSEPHSRDAESR